MKLPEKETLEESGLNKAWADDIEGEELDEETVTLVSNGMGPAVQKPNIPISEAIELSKDGNHEIHVSDREKVVEYLQKQESGETKEDLDIAHLSDGWNPDLDPKESEEIDMTEVWHQAVKNEQGENDASLEELEAARDAWQDRSWSGGSDSVWGEFAEELDEDIAEKEERQEEPISSEELNARENTDIVIDESGGGIIKTSNQTVREELQCLMSESDEFEQMNDENGVLTVKSHDWTAIAE